mgnify:CR=1 FL=1
MKLVILAGGLGTRISEETNLRPKPMIEIDGKPIIWHIMKYYSTFGIDEFGASAPAKDVFNKFGLTPKHISSKIMKRIKK